MTRAIEPVSVEEFVLRVQDGQKADLLDGVIYTASPDSPEAADLNLFLSSLMNVFVRKRKLGKVYGPRSAFRLFPNENYAPEPDVAFVRQDRVYLWKGAVFQGPPDLAVEIAVPDSIDRDTITKRNAYERAEVKEYWIVDLAEARCVFLQLDGKTYREVQPRRTFFHSEVVPGFWLDTDWLFSDGLPPPDECLEKILGSRP